MDIEQVVNEIALKEARFEEWERQTDIKITKIEETLQNINSLTQSIYELTNEVKLMRENVNSIDDRVKEIELQPAKRYNTIIEKVILVVVSGVVGFFLNGGHF